MSNSVAVAKMLRAMPRYIQNPMGLRYSCTEPYTFVSVRSEARAREEDFQKINTNPIVAPLQHHVESLEKLVVL